MDIAKKHYVLDTPMFAPWLENMKIAVFGMGCFWGAERKFWESGKVYSTQVGYTGGTTNHPNYEQVCSGRTGHNEVVQIIFSPEIITYQELLIMFWENHNPTQGMAQGNDIGVQYRSGIYVFDDVQYKTALASLETYQTVLLQAGYPKITTEICRIDSFYYAEDYHQQYLAKNPSGYCGVGGTAIAYS